VTLAFHPKETVWSTMVKDRFSIAAHVKPPGYIVSSFYVPESYG
jgi:hypothetical protein